MRITFNAMVCSAFILSASQVLAQTSSRDIVAKVEDGTAYVISGIDRREIDSRVVESRVLTERFRHKVDNGIPVWRGGWLVSPTEASQPARARRSLVISKSDPGGPRVTVKSPGASKELKPPVKIEVTFEPQENATIDLASLKVTYVAFLNIDITDRLAPYLTPLGIRAEGAELPPGKHTIEIDVKDSAGRRSVERLSFKVLD